MQNHKVKVAIPYAALEPLGVSLLQAGQVDLAGICVLFDAQIAAIRTQYQDIVFDTNLEVRTFGDAATVYLRDGEIVSVAAYYMEDPDATSPKSWTEHYYFNGSSGAPFFAFIERTGYDGWSELRLYFDGRTLLRWIEDDGTPHDNDQNSDYADYYYEEGCLAYANALAALSQ